MTAATFLWAAAAPARAGEHSAIVMDAAGGEVLHAERADRSRAPASLTKLMTLYLVFEALEAGDLALGERLEVSDDAAGQPPTRLGLEAGETIRTLDAVKAVIVRSANDASVVLAERLAGSEARFARRMTERARALGLSRTRFANASGLPHPDQTMTARDAARLADALTRDFPSYYTLFSLTSMSWEGERIASHNNILHMVEGADGLKTGYTDAARYCLAASAERDGRRLIAVVMGAPDAASRDAYVARLLEAGFGTVAARPPTPTLVSMRPPSQTTASDRRLNIVVEEAAPPVPAPVPTPIAARIAPAPELPALRADRWSVQVGAFSTPSQADARLALLAADAAEAVASGRPAVEQAGDALLWRARFTGYDASGAGAACAALKRLGASCFVVPER
ncbi:MAG: D-alanyl-D-alanine carboxypeptidase [Caulobacterales bacterium]|nr:D-alanyl-D-alanine carboxypeptidase [Caulobacterales bacterium]